MSKEYKQYSKKDKLPLKYACFQPEVREAIAKMSMPLLVKDHIDDLYDLITYQMIQNSIEFRVDWFHLSYKIFFKYVIIGYAIL